MGNIKIIRASALIGACGAAMAQALSGDYVNAVATVFAALSATGLIKAQ